MIKRNVSSGNKNLLYLLDGTYGDNSLLKKAEKIAYNIFEKTGKIEDYKTYKNINSMVKSYEKELCDSEFGMQ